MPVTVTLDQMLVRRRMTGKQLAEAVGLSETQLSMFKSGKIRGVRFSTIAKMCAVLECVPGDLLGYLPDPADLEACDE